MANEFYALMGRMRYITRWGLMRNTFSENISEHSHMTAVLAHALALIRRDILNRGGGGRPARRRAGGGPPRGWGRPARARRLAIATPLSFAS